MKVAVLGCGPTGLLSAHAAELLGAEVDIISKKRKSHLFGSQYLHEPIEGVIAHSEGEPVKYVTHGTPEEYRRKTHGKWWDGIVAPEDFETDHMAWDIRRAYDRLWRMYGSTVKDYEIGRHGHDSASVYSVANYDLGLYNYDLTINTLPRPVWKVDGDEFIFSEGWAVGDAPEEGRFAPMHDSVPDNTIICDGTPDKAWTRLSKVFGYTTVEWPHHVTKPPIQGVARVTKPLRYTPGPSDNPANSFLHVGRYGKWEKGVVVTDAFNEVTKKIQEMM